MARIALTVNGNERSLDADPEMPLLWALRDLLGLKGTKYSCGMSLCGSCTVHVDGDAVRSCTTTLGAVEGRSVTTIEGLSGDRSHPLQKAWIEVDVPQCGYCQPGQIMAAAALLRRNPDPDDDEIDDALSPILCRCGTYQRIRRAVRRAAKEV